MQAAYFDDAPTRANILNFLTVQIATLPGLAITRTALAEWLAVLDTRALAKALRLAQENDGQVLDRDLSVEGFGAGEQQRFIAQAQELIAILDGRTVLRDGREITPVTRLAVIGEKIAQRRAAAREGAAR